MSTPLITKFVLSRISPLKYLVTITSLIIGITMPIITLDEPKYQITGLFMVVSSALVLYSLKKVKRVWLKYSSFFAMLVWLFMTLFAIAGGHWIAALWLTFPNVCYFAYFYLFASLKMEFAILPEE